MKVVSCWEKASRQLETPRTEGRFPGFASWLCTEAFCEAACGGRGGGEAKAKEGLDWDDLALRRRLVTGGMPSGQPHLREAASLLSAGRASLQKELAALRERLKRRRLSLVESSASGESRVSCWAVEKIVAQSEDAFLALWALTADQHSRDPL